MKNLNKNDFTIQKSVMRELTVDELNQVAGASDFFTCNASEACAGSTAFTAPTGPGGITGPSGPTGFTGPTGSEPTGGSTDNTTVGETIID